MSYSGRTLEELNVMDDFLMNRVAEDEAVGEAFCRRLLTVLLQKKLGKIHVRTQYALPALTPDLRGIRMDVQVEELNDDPEEIRETVMNIYDIEPHMSRDLDLPRHNRFYQARIDSRGLKSGEKDFKKLPNLYVLTILNYDPFGYDYMVYHVHNKCVEVPELDYGDGLRFFYFYTEGKKGGSPEIGRLLKYIKDSTDENVTDETTREIDSYVKQIKVQPEVRFAYMRFEDILYYERKEAAEKAGKEARAQAIEDLLEEYGEVPERIKRLLEETDDSDRLKKWLKLAAKVSDMQEFEEKVWQDVNSGKPDHK